MSELDKGIIMDEWMEIRPNHLTGEPEEWKVITGQIGLQRRGEITPSALKRDMETVLTRDMGKVIYRKIKQEFVRLAIDDVRTYSRKHEEVYETPLLKENEIMLSPIKMAELMQKGSLEIIVLGKQ